MQPMCGPLNKREDGTVVFASPIWDGHMPMIALSDLGFWARYTFDHRAESSAQDFEIASEMVGWDQVVEAFTRVTGQPAVFKKQTVDEWWENFEGVDNPVANERRVPDGSTTFRQNFSSFWKQWKDDIITRDMGWIKSIRPKSHTVESWMKETGYTGKIGRGVLKNVEDGKGQIRFNFAKMSKL